MPFSSQPPNSFLTHAGSGLSRSILQTLSFSAGEAAPGAVLGPTWRRKGETRTQCWTREEGSGGPRRVLGGEPANILGRLRNKARDTGRQSQHAGEVAEVQKRVLDLQTPTWRTLGYNRSACLCKMLM